MRQAFRFWPVLLLVALVGLVAFAGCGGSATNVGGPDGGLDGTLHDGSKDGAGGDGKGHHDGAGGGDGSGKEGGGGKDGSGGACLNVGAACATPGDCCSGNCVGKVCEVPSCTSDGKACKTDGDCCSGSCGSGGTCAPLNTSCKTLGNSCSGDADCCSKLCKGGVCSASSFCAQNGDVCTTNGDCCGGLCTIMSGGTKGTCSQPAGHASNCTAVDGTLCGGLVGDGGTILDEAGLPSCGGACCSRLCAPYAPTGVLICQPATGCHVVGDLCTKDSDCCGSAGLPGSPKKPVTCDITPPATVGVCRNPMMCKPNGDVCKLSFTSCNASCDCCSGNCETKDTCKQDKDGVPRCTGAMCVDAGASCASSADCCDGLPCIPNVDGGMPPYICGNTVCEPACKPCTTNADCCAGLTCDLPLGSTDGTCGPCNPDAGSGDAGKPKDGGKGDSGKGDSGTPCAMYGQSCKVSSDCCSGVPCLDGNTPCTGGSTCTCHDAIH